MKNYIFRQNQKRNLDGKLIFMHLEVTVCAFYLHLHTASTYTHLLRRKTKTKKENLKNATRIYKKIDIRDTDGLLVKVFASFSN